MSRRLLWTILIYLLTVCRLANALNKTNVVQLGLMSFVPGFEPILVSVDAARTLAKEIINNQTDILPDHSLEFIFKEETGDVGIAFLGALELAGIQARQSETVENVVLVLGASFSSTTQAALSAAQYFDSVYLSTTATSSSLNEREKYPTFSRLCPNDDLQAEVLAQFAYERGWRTMGTFYTTGVYQSGLATAFHRTFEDLLNGTIGISASFAEAETRNSNTPIDISAQVATLKASGVLIFFISMRWADFEIAYKELQKQGMLRPPYVYLGPDSLTRNFDESALDGFVVTSPGINISTPKYLEMVQNWTTVYQQNPALLLNRDASNLENFAAYGYDSVWVAAHGIHRYNVLQEYCNFTYPNPPPPEFTVWFPPIFGDPCTVYNTKTMRIAIYEIMRYVEFDGVSGYVAFDSSSERRYASWDILNRQANSWVTVGSGTTGRVQLFSDVPMIWPGNSTIVPLDHIPPVIHSALVLGSTRVGYLVIASILLAMILVLLIIVIVLRDSRAMKSASPKLLAVTLLGSLTIVIVAILHTIDQTPSICTAKLWLFHLGLTTAIAPLLLTLYRLYRLFNNTRLESLDNLRDKNLLFYLLIMLFFEIILLIIWTSYQSYTLDNVDRCSSTVARDIFPILAAVKGVYITAAGILSYFTRNVPARFHHSVSVALCVYNLAIVSITWILVAEFLSTNPSDAQFKQQFEIACLLISQFNLVALLLGPKIYAIHVSGEFKLFGSIQHEIRRKVSLSPDGGLVESQSVPGGGLDIDTLIGVLQRRKVELQESLNQLTLIQLEVNERREGVFLIEDEVTYLRKTKKRRSSFFLTMDQVRIKKRTHLSAEMALRQGSTSNLHTGMRSGSEQ